MKRIGSILLLFAVAQLLSGSGADGQVLRGEGDFEFFLDRTSLPMKDGGILELFQIAVPTKEIRYEEDDGKYSAAVKIVLTLYKDSGKVHERGLVVRDSRDTPPQATDLSGFIYMSDSSTVAEGSYILDVRVEDLQRRKKTLFGLVKRKYFYSEIKGHNLDIVGFREGRIALSSPVLLWKMDRNGYFVPNPMQIYGLKNDTLSFFASAVVPQQEGYDSLQTHMTVINKDGEVTESKTGSTKVRDGKVLVSGKFDVNTFPAGNYRVNVDLLDRGILKASSGKNFSVAWQLVNWQKPRRDVLVEARLMFHDAEYGEFRRMSIGEQERMLDGYWKKLDPTPHTAVNETYEKFQNRVRYADSHFKGGGERGALSDRGQAFIKYGPPDDIVQESVPFSREDLNEAIDKLEDRYKVIVHSTRKGPGTDYLMMRDVSGGLTRPFRGGGSDTGAFELWIYTLRGDPLLEKDRIMPIGSGLRFLFVDKDGIGKYMLIGTSEEKEGVTTPTSQPE
jgi:GWxTD domain-containing protein